MLVSACVCGCVLCLYVFVVCVRVSRTRVGGECRFKFNLDCFSVCSSLPKRIFVIESDSFVGGGTDNICPVQLITL